MLTNHINPVDFDLIHEAVHEYKILLSQCCMIEATGVSTQITIYASILGVAVSPATLYVLETDS